MRERAALTQAGRNEYQLCLTMPWSRKCLAINARLKLSRDRTQCSLVLTLFAPLEELSRGPIMDEAIEQPVSSEHL